VRHMDPLDPLAWPARRLLLVEDDADLSSMLTELLTEEGYAVTTVRDGQAGLHRGLVEQWDVLVVDRGLPVIEGVDLVSRLRSKGMSAPVLLLTARGTVADRVEGLDAGAQDYLVKPFDVDELLARLRALLRPLGAGATELTVTDGRRLVVGEQRVVGADDEVLLSRQEALLLETLARRPSRVFTRVELLDTVFGRADTLGAVDTYVHYLRRKLGRGIVETVHGVGYRLGQS
jgi:two-component system, OmpR family, response regulator QseB